MYDRTLLLVRGVKPVDAFGGGLETYRRMRKAQYGEEQVAIKYLRDKRRELMRQDGLTVQNMLLTGDPATELLVLSAAHADSAIVVSTHGRGGWRRVLVGSVAAEVVHRSTLPVFVVPPIAQVATETSVGWNAREAAVIGSGNQISPAEQSSS
jgi:nucleotide-binding universal stress UspA family protein